ncbi:PD-(D/E)XK nuclease-like domain-containing protein [Planococcus koreensis]|uniref:PD-(D/E)XK nuclease-like domain-containing protein n=1 Tax=Planococcus koreensis TaxID=112331 RepID=UPI0039FD0D2A
MVTMPTFQLNSQNYHSTEANQRYFSVSQFKQFNQCSAKAMAMLNEEYVRKESSALLVGSYTHAAFDTQEEFEKLIEENHSSIFNNRGNKYSDFQTADAMIQTIKDDPFAMFAMEGEKEQIYTAEIFGVPWKVKVDSVNHGRRTFTDLKTTQSLSKRTWSTKYEMYVSFVEAWDYVLQMAIYRKVLELNTGFAYNPYIVAVTKEDPPDKAVIHFDIERFQFEIDFVEAVMEKMISIKNGEIAPTRCEQCDYCRSTKKLSNSIEMGRLLD